MKEQIKQLRVEIDGLAQLTEGLKPLKVYNKYKENEIINIPTEDAKILAEYNTPEIQKAVDSLYLGKAWLGKVLGELGNENPYGSGYKTKEDIVPTQDVATISDIADKENLYDKELIGEVVSFDANWKNKNHIEKVDWLRTKIQQIIDSIVIDTRVIKSNSKSEKYFEIAWQHLSEARFHLGFELERIKQSN